MERCRLRPARDPDSTSYRITRYPTTPIITNTTRVAIAVVLDMVPQARRLESLYSHRYAVAIPGKSHAGSGSPSSFASVSQLLSSTTHGKVFLLWSGYAVVHQQHPGVSSMFR